ncbi:MAG: Holliday junction branch migration protein RuvA [Candidatus Orphnella occulta]|nr:Holliday junction branch migration protein RuvA [Candidatus Orphnella occulta]MDP8296561.1 Holliday junction branch migration protein RuvA [Candidatus Orphnella occulta]
MINAIRGKLIKKNQASIAIDVGGLIYEVLIPLTVYNGLESASVDSEIFLFTFHYYATDHSRSFPVLIGFINEVEREFFERFITVSGVGPKAAVRAINRPISEIARAIDRGDLVFLKSLPGIGEQRAKEIIAKLQNKIGKFALLQDSFGDDMDSGSKLDIKNEALQVLIQLQYKKQQAEDMIEKAIQRNPKISASEELLNAVYKQKRIQP